MDISGALKNTLLSARDVGIVELQKTLGQAASGTQKTTLDTAQIRPDENNVPTPQPKPKWIKTPVGMMVSIGAAVVLAVVLVKKLK